VINFDYYMPTKLLFGAKKVLQIGKITKEYGNKALIVTGRSSTKKTGVLDKVRACLEEEGIESVVFDRVESNPLIGTVEEGSKFAKEENCDVVIALGGGSALDAGKAIALLVENEGDISEYIFGKQAMGALPIIAITTTAGTGSEADCLAVLTNPENNDKKSLKTPFTYPKVSIIDPELMTTLPKRIVASTCIDALCHAMEAYVAERSNPISEIMALKAIELISENIEKVYKDPNNIEAWGAMALANTLGGMVIDASGVALAHGLEHPVSGLLNVAHGEGLAAIIVNWAEFSYSSSMQKFSNIAKALGEEIEGLPLEETAKKSVIAIEKILEKVELTPTLSDLGVKEEHIEWLVNNSLKTMIYAINNNPKVATSEEIRELYMKSL